MKTQIEYLQQIDKLAGDLGAFAEHLGSERSLEYPAILGAACSFVDQYIAWLFATQDWELSPEAKSLLLSLQSNCQEVVAALANGAKIMEQANAPRS